MNPPGSRYNATERLWVKAVLAKLSPAERLEYERRMQLEPCHRTGKKYDGTKGRIAEQVRYESSLGKTATKP
jgi:hypothetical protein